MACETDLTPRKSEEKPQSVWHKLEWDYGGLWLLQTTLLPQFPMVLLTPDVSLG